MFAYSLLTENDQIVVVSFTLFSTEKGTFLAVEKAAFDEIRRIADAFEQSIACEYQKWKQVSSDEEESSKEDDEGQTSSTAEIRDNKIFTERVIEHVEIITILQWLIYFITELIIFIGNLL